MLKRQDVFAIVRRMMESAKIAVVKAVKIQIKGKAEKLPAEIGKGEIFGAGCCRPRFPFCYINSFNFFLNCLAHYAAQKIILKFFEKILAIVFYL